MAALIVLALCTGTMGTIRLHAGQGTEGIKQTKRFIKTGGVTSQAVAEAKLGVQHTPAVYNALVQQPSKNLKGDYKKLLKSVRATNDHVADVRTRVAQMEAEGKTYFEGRSNALTNSSDADLRKRGDERLAESRQQYDGVLRGLREAGEALDPFMKDPADQITFLGHDRRRALWRATSGMEPIVSILSQRFTSGS